MNKIVALTGAGISKESGIPTFDEMGDLRLKLSRGYFHANPGDFYRILIEMKDCIDAARPNNAHLALAKYKVPIVTMNIDGLHKKAGSDNVIEIHGNYQYVTCKKCGGKHDFDIVRSSIYCDKCGTILEPNIVLYDDDIPLIYEAINLVRGAKKLLVVGTSFYTSTANTLVHVAGQVGIEVEIINSKAEIEIPRYLDKLFQ
jgi:NAD-dependent deacetylase